LPKTDPDRIESLKAASITGATAGFVAAMILGIRRTLALGFEEALHSLGAGLGGQTFLFSIAIAVLSGSLFGITYRYAIRQDENFQIQSGVVFAFALVRGLALVNVAAALSLRGWPFLTGILESVVIFAAAGAALELGFRLKWVAKVSCQVP
jgi:Na+-transporting NADH:ubiquinone oxidoreductase subunit NqrE